MAYFNVKINSRSLYRPVSFQAVIPNDGDRSTDRPLRTLFLLHGYTQSGWNWVPEYLTERYGFAVIIPDGENSFWLDGLSHGHKYCTFIGEELPDYVNRTFGLANSAEDTCILGLSMGGFGALHTALTYPGRFGKAGAMSSALIIHEVAQMKPGESNGAANYEYYRECFGEPSKVLESSANPEVLIDRLTAGGQKLPGIYMCCGTEDFLLENNRAFHEFLLSRGVEHEYAEGPGTHDFPYWNERIPVIAEWMFGES